MESREALFASVGADLEKYDDARMGLSDDEMQKLTSSVTDCIRARRRLPVRRRPLSAGPAALPCQQKQCKTKKPRAVVLRAGLGRSRLSFFLPRAYG
jgi:hypothetical protein